MADISISSNLLSVVLQQNLSKTTKALNKSMERLSTGKKINSAADGAADLSISKKLSSQISGTIVAQNNVQHGILMMNQADSGLNSINQNLAKIRDLAVKAASGTYSQEERDAMALEAQGCVDQINNIAKSTSFNGLTLLDGSITDLKLQVGANTSDTLNVKDAFVNSSASSMGITTNTIRTAFASPESANAFIAKVDSAITKTSSHLATVGAYSNSLNSTLDSLRVKEQNLTASNSLIMDVDYAKEISNYIQLQILQQANISLLSQANSLQSNVLAMLP